MANTIWRRLASHLGRSKANPSLLFNNECVAHDSVIFSCKYLGTIPMDNTASGDKREGEVIDDKKIDLKYSFADKQPKVELHISPNCVCINSLIQNNETLLEIPMNSVAYCIVGRKHKNTVGFVSRNLETDRLECHAFITNRSKQITTAFVQAFQLATGVQAAAVEH